MSTTRKQIDHVFTQILSTYPEAEVISKYFLDLKDHFILTHITNKQLTAFKISIEGTLKQKLMPQIDFILWDFLENKYDTPTKPGIAQLIQNMEASVHIENNKRRRMYTYLKPSLQFQAGLDNGKFYIEKKLYFLLKTTTGPINTELLIKSINSLLFAWRLKLKRIIGQGTSVDIIDEIHVNLIKLKESVDFTRAIFTIRSNYISIKENNNRLFSSKIIKANKHKKLTSLEEALVIALAIPDLIFDPVKLYSLVCYDLHGVSVSIQTGFLGKRSKLADHIDEIILQYQPLTPKGFINR